MSKLVSFTLWLSALVVLTIGAFALLNATDRVLWRYHTTATYEARGYINLCRSQGVAEVEDHSDGTYTITCLKGEGE